MKLGAARFLCVAMWFDILTSSNYQIIQSLLSG